MEQSFAAAMGSVKNILEYKHVHLVGIKGVAMTALALCLQDAGTVLSGSDIAEEFVTQDILLKRKFHIFHGFDPTHINPDLNLVIYTGAHQGKHNPEVKRAVELGIPVMSHAEALGRLTAGKKVISVCGTGGKSTTSAMVAWILDQAGQNPSFAVGVGNIPNLGVSGRYRADSKWFVCEADEYAVDPTDDHRPRFIYQHPETIICTNLSFDHPDVYSDFAAMQRTFATFFETAVSNIYVNGDCTQLLDLYQKLKRADSISFESLSGGLSPKADYQISNYKTIPGQTSFSFKYIGPSEWQPFIAKDKIWTGSLQIPGLHNVRNALLAYLVTVNECGIEAKTALKALASFKGTMRRFEHKGVVNGADWYDDYAHTPDELQATLAALRDWCPGKKIMAVFQPHTYSRTLSLFEDFSHSFTQADEVILLDIFASAREQETKNITSDMLAAAITKHDPNKVVKNMKTIDAARKYLTTHLDSSMVVITLGAGDVYKIYEHS